MHQEVAAAAEAPAPSGPRAARQLGTSTSMTFEGEVCPLTPRALAFAASAEQARTCAKLFSSAYLAALQVDAVRAVIDADVGRKTRSNGMTAAMASVVPEPDLVRVNAGTGPQLQLDSVWSALALRRSTSGAALCVPIADCATTPCP